VDGIKREYRGRLKVVFVSMDRSDGKELAKQYGVVGTPTILLLDSEGNQVSVLRGAFPAPMIERAVEDLLAQ
jgi:thioredoxin-like negative regulator of GroEL